MSVSIARIEQLANHIGKEVEVRGWLYNKRSSGAIHFLIVRDGTGIVQVIVTKESVSGDRFEALKKLAMESSLIVRGLVKEEKRAPGGVELAASAVTVVGGSNEDYPIQKKEHNVDFLMDNRHLWIRTPRQAAILKIRAAIIRDASEFLDSNGFVRCDTPILTPAACEGTTTLFPVEYFDQQTAYLTQSGQLYNEATAAALGKVYCFGPTFRAEKSKTRRHLNEFWMLEPEMAFATLDDVMAVEEGLISHIIQTVLRAHRADLEFIERDVSNLEKVTPPFPRISYTEAVETLHKSGNQMP
ncbi:MAG: asparagine--tRNA ligase, partial [bacterium]